MKIPGKRKACKINDLKMMDIILTRAQLEIEHSSRDGRALAWQVPEDFESKAIALDMKQGRASGVKLLSRLDLDVQLASPSATWLDRAQVDYGKGGIERISAKTSIFAKELDTAFQQRRTWLIEQGYAGSAKKSTRPRLFTNAAM